MKIKIIPLAQVVMYDIIINLLGNLSFWYNIVLKGIIEYTWGYEFESEQLRVNFVFYNYFAFGQLFSSVFWTATLKYISEKNVILLSLIAQAFIYLIKYYYFDSIGVIYLCRFL